VLGISHWKHVTGVKPIISAADGICGEKYYSEKYWLTVTCPTSENLYDEASVSQM
jgi:hypothetical protein